MKNAAMSVAILLFAIQLQAQSTAPRKIVSTPFQGTKTFCSFSGKSKYRVTIKGSKATFLYLYKEYTTKVLGSFRNGKVYTNDPYEKQSKTGGRFYLVTKEMVRVLNLENGDYEEYDVCK
jgi:hypothetical protein